MNREGAIAGMITGILFTACYIIYFKFIDPSANNTEHWFMGISPEGIGTVGMIINFGVALSVSRFFPPPPEDVQEMITEIRVPRSSPGAAKL